MQGKAKKEFKYIPAGAQWVLPVEVQQIWSSHKGLCLGVVVCNRMSSPSGRPRAVRPRSNGHSGLTQRCRVSTLWLGLHLTVLSGCLETSLGQTQTPRSP